MIVTMKTVTVITLEDARQQTVDTLGELGVLHVAIDPSHQDGAEEMREQRQQIERAIRVLEQKAERADSTSTETEEGSDDIDQALVTAGTVLDSVERRSQLNDELARVERDLERLADWNLDDPGLIAELAEGGVQVAAYEVAPDEVEALIEELPLALRLTETKKGPQRVLGIATGDDTLPERVTVTLGESGGGDLTERSEELQREIAAIDERLVEHTSELSGLYGALGRLDEELSAVRVASVFEDGKSLAWVTGYVPHDMVSDLERAASREGWGLVVRDPDEDEPVPTKIRNPKPIGIIKPVFDLLGTVPGYREMDISFFFLTFFTVFFAMIIGDGGYGLILTLGTLLFMVRTLASGKKPGRGSALMLLLSLATVAWGAVTGNWFGYAPFADLPLLNQLVIPELSITNEQSTLLIQYMCFIIGTVHLSIAHIWNFIREIRSKPRIRALAQAGWLSMVLGLYYLVLQLVIDAERFPMPDFAPVMIAAGLAAVIIFGQQEAGTNFFVGIGKGFAGLITTVLDGISAFSDIISYIRLFAVGLASLAIAEAFNEMATGIFGGMGEGVLAAVVAGLILFLGHTLNIAMGALSVVVHGVRLNMLEFSGHLGMEWTGVEYAPFASRYKTS